MPKIFSAAGVFSLSAFGTSLGGPRITQITQITRMARYRSPEILFNQDGSLSLAIINYCCY
ncbi:MAG: hypothetical protein MJZ70_02215 [Bacteroidales bacterium]|nr:hypothetical protein [Bacteroidales bacterium]